MMKLYKYALILKTFFYKYGNWLIAQAKQKQKLSDGFAKYKRQYNSELGKKRRLHKRYTELHEQNENLQAQVTEQKEHTNYFERLHLTNCQKIIKLDKQNEKLQARVATLENWIKNHNEHCKVTSFGIYI